MISKEKLLDVSIDYYIHKMTQKKIAEKLDISHVQVGKYLKQAEKCGIVSITVNMPLSKDDIDGVTSIFKKIFKLKNLVLVQGSENSDKSHKRVIDKASSYLISNFSNTDFRLGVGWGKTIYDMSLFKNREVMKTNWKYSPVCFLNRKVENKFFDTAQIVENFSNNWGGSIQKSTLNLIRLSQKMSNLDFFDGKESFTWSNIDALICGLGCATRRSPMSRSDIFREDILGKIKSKEIVGDIINYYYDIDGNLFPSKEQKTLISIDELKEIPKTIAIASGFTKVESIIGALRTGLVDTLITDIQTSQHIIDYLK